MSGLILYQLSAFFGFRNRPGPVLFGEVSPSSAKHRVAGASRRWNGAPGMEMEVSPTSPPKKSSQNHPKSGGFPRKIGVLLTTGGLTSRDRFEQPNKGHKTSKHQQTYQKRKNCSTSRVLWLTCTVQGQARCGTVSTGQYIYIYISKIYSFRAIPTWPQSPVGPSALVS